MWQKAWAYCSSCNLFFEITKLGKPITYYLSVLKVDYYASLDEIKASYKSLMNKWHPDKITTQDKDKQEYATEFSKEINEAYTQLKKHVASTKKPIPEKSTVNTEECSYADKGKSTQTGRVNVKSSNIKSIGYNIQTKVLQIEFLTGSVYEYYEVPERVYLELIKAESKGKYTNRYIYRVFESNSL